MPHAALRPPAHYPVRYLLETPNRYRPCSHQAPQPTIRHLSPFASPHPALLPLLLQYYLLNQCLHRVEAQELGPGHDTAAVNHPYAVVYFVQVKDALKIIRIARPAHILLIRQNLNRNPRKSLVLDNRLEHAGRLVKTVRVSGVHHEYYAVNILEVVLPVWSHLPGSTDLPQVDFEAILILYFLRIKSLCRLQCLPLLAAQLVKNGRFAAAI